MKIGDKINLKDAVKTGKNPFAGRSLSDFYVAGMGDVSYTCEIVSENSRGGYYTVKLPSGELTKLKKKLLKPEYH